MKAIVQTKYGGPEVLQLENIEKPVPEKNEVLIKVCATAVNDYDWCMMTGKPRLYRLMFGLFKPKTRIPGMELSGRIEALGENVTRFKPGDAVYGDLSDYGFGSFAEYVCINEQAVMNKPGKMSFAEAASIPHAACLAAQGLIDVGKIKAKQKVLINGAGGGVGTFGLNIAKTFSAEVTGVDTGEKLKVMTAIGFDHVIDYQEQDFTQAGQFYDLILDTKTNRSPFTYVRCLAAQGKYVTVGGNIGRLLQTLCLKPWISKFYGKTLAIVSLKPNKDWQYIEELYNSGILKPVLDGPYSLADTPELIRYFGEGKHTGKIVISLES